MRHNSIALLCYIIFIILYYIIIILHYIISHYIIKLGN